MPDVYTKRREGLADAAEIYREAFVDSFRALCEGAGWPKALLRSVRKFIDNEATPEYWLSLSLEERAGQILEWVVAQRPNAPVSAWAPLPIVEAADAALTWLEESEAA